jgi:hypothetical protein
MRSCIALGVLGRDVVSPALAAAFARRAVTEGGSCVHIGLPDAEAADEVVDPKKGKLTLP